MKKKTLIVALAIVPASLALFAKSPNPPLEKQLAAATEGNDHHAVAEICRRLLEKKPSDAELLTRLIRAQFSMYDYEGASTTLLKLKPLLPPEDPEVLEFEGNLHMRAKRYDEGLRAWEAANRARPGNAALLAKIARQHAYTLKNPENAARYYRELSTLRKDAHDHVAVAEAAIALRDWNSLIERTTILKTQFATHGLAKTKVPRFERLIDNSTRISELDERVRTQGSGKLDALLDRGWLFHEIGFHELALADARRALKLDPEALYVRMYFALFSAPTRSEYERISAWGIRSWYSSRDTPDRGFLVKLRKLEQGIRAQPNDAEPLTNRAGVLLEQKVPQPLLALADAIRALKISPKNPKALAIKARCLAANGKYGKAVATITKAIDLSPDDLSVLKHGVEILMQQGEYEEAIELCERMLKHNPQNSFARSCRSTCHQRLQKPVQPLNL